MEDGRYLIFYSFEDETASTPAASEASDDEAQAEGEREPLAPEPVAEEERRV